MSENTEAARLADRIVDAYAAGRSYLRALGELCARCEDAGLDHAVLLDKAMHRAGLPA